MAATVTTVFDAWKLYRELVLESASRREFISETGRWKKHLAPVFKNMPLVDVRTLHVHKFRSLLEKKSQSANDLSLSVTATAYIAQSSESGAVRKETSALCHAQIRQQTLAVSLPRRGRPASILFAGRSATLA